SFALLPDELLLAIPIQGAYVRSIKGALRLRFVCKRFANIATTAIFNSSILDCEDLYSRIIDALDFWAEYLAYQALLHAHRKSQDMITLLLITQHICRYRNASADETSVTIGARTDDNVRECVLELCIMLTLPHNSLPLPTLRTRLHVTEGEADESSLNFRRHLCSAAAWIGEKGLVVELVLERCNSPLRATSHRDHIEIVKFFIFDNSSEAPHICIRPALIIGFAMINDHTELIDLALDPSWHRGLIAPGYIPGQRLAALDKTCSLGIFIRLLEDAKPHIAEYESNTCANRRCSNTGSSRYREVFFCFEKEGANIHADDDALLFQSRCPAELFQRDYNLLSHASRVRCCEVLAW
ncbi:hypothetical protein BKA66DRAFT_597793, partial [Pyrenochaeta sp. MPI-SDFR-AT-0127]